jgi:hypothetical protein
MDLKDFIRESLVQIVGGIQEANDALKNTDAIVNPNGIVAYSTGAKAFGRIGKQLQERGSLVHLVSFDVALLAETEKQTGGGLKISIASIGVGADGNKNESRSTESRIKFEIPVKYPTSRRS